MFSMRAFCFTTTTATELIVKLHAHRTYTVLDEILKTKTLNEFKTDHRKEEKKKSH